MGSGASSELEKGRALGEGLVETGKFKYFSLLQTLPHPRRKSPPRLGEEGRYPTLFFEKLMSFSA